MQKTYDVYAIGNALVDTEVSVSDALLAQLGVEKGLMTLVDEARQAEISAGLDKAPANRAAGGSACNTLVAVCQFGGTGFYSCKVANDADGALYVADLADAGADTNMQAPFPAGTTGKCLVLITPDAERSMNTYLGISADIAISETDLDALAQSSYLYLEGYLASSETGRAAARYLHDKARELDVKTALTFSDAAMVQFCRDGLDLMLAGGVDLLFCNAGEALAYTQCDSLTAALDALKPLAANIVITRGEDGAWIWDGHETHDILATNVTALNANGAGDMFAGAYLYAITQGWPARAAGEFAACAASQVVAQFGPRLTREQQRKLLQA